MLIYWFLLIVFGTILTCNIVLLNKKTLCKSDRDEQVFDFAKLFTPFSKKLLKWGIVIILVTVWIAWLKEPSTDTSKPTVDSLPAKASVQTAQAPTKAIAKVDLPNTQAVVISASPQTNAIIQPVSPSAKTTVKNTPRLAQPGADVISDRAKAALQKNDQPSRPNVISPPAKTTIQNDEPNRPEWLHVDTEKKEWSPEVAAPSTKSRNSQPKFQMREYFQMKEYFHLKTNSY